MKEIAGYYQIHRNNDGSVIAKLKCNQCQNWFEVPADDPLFVALICGLKNRFNCGKHGENNEIPSDCREPNV